MQKGSQNGCHGISDEKIGSLAPSGCQEMYIPAIPDIFDELPIKFLLRVIPFYVPQNLRQTKAACGNAVFLCIGQAEAFRQRLAYGIAISDISRRQNPTSYNRYAAVQALWLHRYQFPDQGHGKV